MHGISIKKTSSSAGQCSWVRLSFINGVCDIDNGDFSDFKRCARTINLFKAFTDVAMVDPSTSSTEAEMAGAGVIACAAYYSCVMLFKYREKKALMGRLHGF
ncbi:MAG: hypothetical protein QS748_04820 [Candidatus Endonucleobacter bathymodioli]|uniref:Uncharacterized protein n=1 Tax=Candidatus Endonucleibacter bathymodioli TaxID=539814 RepID=A0AA90NKD3_9GAMM|nr:hypothetical protein [Candidatus Endonucleobacter bathymodioli]